LEKTDKANLLGSFSFRVSIFIVILSYFALGTYWLYVTCRYTPSLILNFSYYREMLKETWWLVTYYSSDLGLSIGIIIRWLAGVLALYTAFRFLRGGENSFNKIRRKVGIAVLLEGIYILTYGPSAFLGFIYPIAMAHNLWYFEPNPPWVIVLLVNGLACLAMVVVIAPPLLKLGLGILRGSLRRDEIIKWSCITCVAYIFAMFWWNYTMAWFATLVYWPERAQPGIEILGSPIASASFFATVLGLLFIALCALMAVMPAIKGHPERISYNKLGYIMLVFSAYFIFMLVLYFAAGGYYAQPTTWMEIIGPHNPDLWCMALILPGIKTLMYARKGKPS